MQAAKITRSCGDGALAEEISVIVPPGWFFVIVLFVRSGGAKAKRPRHARASFEKVQAALVK
jgi:hypothetical protein